MAKIKENKIYKPAYSHIIEDYLKNQSRIVLDFDNWAWMDFRKRTIEYGSAHGSHNEPATVWEYIYFIRYFYIKGITFCTFDELRKAGCKFDMRRKRNRKYALVETPCWMFKQLLRTRKTAQAAFETEIDKCLQFAEIGQMEYLQHFLNLQIENCSNKLEILKKRAKLK